MKLTNTKRKITTDPEFYTKRVEGVDIVEAIKNLHEVTNQIIKDLDLKDYQIIEKKRKRSYFKKFIQSSLIMKYDINTIKINRICSLINGYINVILLDNQLIKNC